MQLKDLVTKPSLRPWPWNLRHAFSSLSYETFFLKFLPPWSFLLIHSLLLFSLLVYFFSFLNILTRKHTKIFCSLPVRSAQSLGCYLCTTYALSALTFVCLTLMAWSSSLWNRYIIFPILQIGKLNWVIKYFLSLGFAIHSRLEI